MNRALASTILLLLLAALPLSAQSGGSIPAIAVSKDRLSFSIPPCLAVTSAEDTLTIFNSGSSPIGITGITITGSPAFTLIAPLPPAFTLPPNGSRLVRVRYTPPGTGTAAGTLTILTTDPDRGSVPVDLAGRADTALIEPSARPLIFPQLLSCNSSSRLKLALRNRGTVADTVRTVNINSPYIVLLPPNLIIPAHDSIVVEVTFAPGLDGSYSSYLSYTYASGGCQLADSVLVTGLRQSATYEISGVDFGDVTVGSAGSGTATVTNRNGTAVRIGAAEILPFSSEITIPTGQFPVTIPANGSTTINVVFTPSAVGPITAGTILRVHIDSLCQAVLDTSVAGRGIAGGVATSRNGVPFDPILGCLTSDSVVMVRNVGKAPVTILSATISPTAAGKFFTLVPSLVQPVTIAPGDSLPLIVRFVPGAGSDSSIAGVMTIGTNDPLRPTIGIALNGRRLVQSLALDGAGFGTVGAGSPTTIRQWLVNTGTAPIGVRDLRAGAPFRVVSTVPATPIILAPGDSIGVDLELTPPLPGSYADSIRIGTTGSCDSFALPVAAIAEDRSVIAGLAAWGDAGGAPGDTVMIPLRLDADLTVAGVTSFTAGARFNPTLLRPLGITLDGTIISGWSIGAQRLERGSILFTVAGAPALAGTGVLVFLRAQVLLGDSTATRVTGGDSVQVDAPRGSLLISPGIFTLTGYCSDGGARLVANGGIFGLKMVAPNPFGGTAQVEFTATESGRTTLALLDPLGHEIARPVDADLSPRTYIVTLSATDFPSGVYYLELRSPTRTAREKIIVVR